MMYALTDIPSGRILSYMLRSIVDAQRGGLEGVCRKVETHRCSILHIVVPHWSAHKTCVDLCVEMYPYMKDFLEGEYLQRLRFIGSITMYR